ncbi:MAG: AmmeMemoRadiSam system protein A [Atopobiaceae bacterium]|nr:AmmeMemoRadiSam system protein A [Atopobiaceae bacterium]
MPILAGFAVPHPPLIIPAVGRGREKGIQATIDAYEEVGRRIAELEPETIVISSPHATVYRDYFHISPGTRARGDFSMFGARGSVYRAEYDSEFASELDRMCRREGVSGGIDYERMPELDHGTMIPMHFVEKHWRDYRLVRIGLSGMNAGEHYRMGRLIQRTAADLGRRVVYIASGDLSHKLLAEGPYGFAPEGPVFDERVMEDFATGNLFDLLVFDHALCERAAECGLRSFQMKDGAFDRTPVSCEALSHEGPFGVGYGIAAVAPVGEEGSDADRDLYARYLEFREDDLASRKASEDPYVKIARLSLESFVREGRRLSVRDLPADLPAELRDSEAGCFVSLKIDGQLRGCIGTILPMRSCLAEEILANAISAGVRDSRFMPVEEEELPELVYDVDVLTEPEPVAGYADLDPVRYGVIVSAPGGRRGVLLPDLDGVDSVEEQVRIAASKGGIHLEDGDYSLERFEVVRHL